MAAPMNVSCWFGSAIALLVLCGPTKADQQVVTVCGASKGMTVTPELGGSPTASRVER
jgi:hypothetical protein